MRNSAFAVAPMPPTGPGDIPEDGTMDRYLAELGRWRVRREHELRVLDELTRTHDDREDLNAHVTSSMALWHAVAQRHDLLLATWEDARAGQGKRDWVAQLIWGLLEMPDGDADALSVPLPDAMRLSDALASSLRARTGIEDGLGLATRVAELGKESARLRTQFDRARDDDRTSAEPDALAELEQELDEIDAQLADLGGRQDGSVVEAGALQARLAQIDQGAIVAAAAEAHGRADVEQARAEQGHLVAKGEGVRSLAERVLNTVYPAPRLGIPDVSALGDVPRDDDPTELAAYVANLSRVGRALDQAHATYAAALAEYADLIDRADRLAKTLAGCGAPTSVDLAGMLTSAKEALHNQPADVQRAAALIAAQEAYLAQLRSQA